VIVDRDGAVRRRFPGEVIRVLTSAGSRIGVMFRDRALELDPELALALPAPAAAAVPDLPTPSIVVPAPVARPPSPRQAAAAAAAILEYSLSNLTIAVYFVGERLRLLQAGNRLSHGDGAVHVDLPSTPLGSAALGDRTTALGLNDGSVWLSGWWGSRLMRTPATNPIVRLAGRPGGARLAGWSRGHILVWNLGGAIPRALPVDLSVGRLLFLGDDRLVAIGHDAWYWMDLKTGISERLDQDSILPMFNDIVVDVERGDALLLDTMLGRVSLMRWSNRAMIGTWRDRVSSAALLGDGVVAVGTSDGRLVIGSSTQPLKVLTMESAVIGVTRIGAHGAVAIDAEGELLAYDLPSGTVTKGSLGEPPSGVLVDDDAGGVIIALGARLVRWTPAGVQELVRVGEPVIHLTRYRNTLAILTASELATLDLRGPPVVRHIANTGREQQLREGSRWAVGIGQRGLIDLVDIATGVRWSKSIHGGLAMFAVSPTGTRVAQLLRSEIALWTYDVPEEPAALRAWLDEMTNATVSEGLDVRWTAPGTKP
jgi:hypothetical protein